MARGGAGGHRSRLLMYTPVSSRRKTSSRARSPAAISTDSGASALEAPFVGTSYSLAERGDTRQSWKAPASMSVT